jgi:hypothetical protein
VPSIARAQSFYLPPPNQPADAWDLVPIAQRVLRWYEVKVSRRVAVPGATVPEAQLWARIDAGRWVADCTCRSAQVVSPDDPRLACPECGGGWYELVFPDDVAAAEAAAEARSPMPREQFWWNPTDPSPWNQQPDEPPAAGGEEPTP